MAETKPFAYSIEHDSYEDFVLGKVGQTLADVVGNSGDRFGNVLICAWFPDRKKETVDEDAYSKIQVEAPSRDAALAEVETVRTSLENKIIENRELGIDNPIDFGVPKWYKLGAPLEEQIKAYIDTNKKETHVWLSKEEIEANAKAEGWA